MIGGLVSEVDRYTCSTTGNSLGDPIASYTVGSTGIACHFVAVTPADREALQAVGGGKSKVADHIVMFKSGQSLTVADRLKFGSDYYEVIGINNPDQMGHHLEVQVARVQGLTA